jgi:hypothetical protein
MSKNQRDTDGYWDIQDVLLIQHTAITALKIPLWLFDLIKELIDTMNKSEPRFDKEKQTLRMIFLMVVKNNYYFC